MSGFYDVLAIPFGYIMHFLFELFGNYFVALFILTLVVKLALLPSSISQQKGSAKQTRLQPKINRIRQKYAGTNGQPATREIQMKIQEETNALYQKEGFSPMSGGCLPLLIQFPVMIGLYGVVNSPLSRVLNIPAELINNVKQYFTIGAKDNYYEIKMLQQMSEGNMPAELADYSEDILRLKDQFQFWNIDLTKTPSWKEPGMMWLIPGLVLILGLITSLIMFSKQKQNNPEMASNPTMGCMTFFSPLMSVVFTFMFPAGVGVYWILSSLFTLVQTIILNKAYSPQKVIAQTMIDETVERRSREAHIKKLNEFSGNEN